MILAMAILAILSLVIAGILTQVNTAWISTYSANQRQETGRELLDFLARDISKAMLPLPATNTANLQFLINGPTVSTTYGNCDNIFFQAPVATSGSSGEVAEVGYFVQWQPAAGTQGPTAQLCRFLVNPSTPGNYLIYTNPMDWINDGLVATVAPGTAPNSLGLIAENVLGLWIGAFDKNGSTVLDSSRRFDSRVTGNLPAVVDISILVLDRVTANHLGAGAGVASVQSTVRASTSAAACLAALPKLLQSGADCFTTRVQLYNSR